MYIILFIFTLKFMKIIGEGTYGCVVKPSLKCKEENMDYRRRVSKIMNLQDAKLELKEMEAISKIPGYEKFAVLVPKMCSPIQDDTFKSVLSGCAINKKVRSDKTFDLRLLLLDDAGRDLSQLPKNLYTDFNERCIFLTSIINLFEGLIFFRDNGIAHLDIKADNLIYNESTRVMKFIDFGMASTLEDFKQLYTSNRISYSWSNLITGYPEETACGKAEHFTLPRCQKKYKNFANNYDLFMDKFVKTIDSFCLTDTLCEIFNLLKLKIKPSVSIEEARFYKDVMTLLESYYHEDLYYRNANLENLKTRYIEILKNANMHVIGSIREGHNNENDADYEPRYIADSRSGGLILRKSKRKKRQGGRKQSKKRKCL